MEQKGHLASLIAIVAVAVVAIVSMVKLVNKAGQPQAAGLQGYTQFTSNQQNQSYIDSADLYQNVQAMSERFASGSAYAIFQADANGVVQRVAPTSLGASPWSFTSTTRITSLIETGSVATFTATSTATAAQVCNSLVWNLAPAGALPTITLPSADDLNNSCLSSDGSKRVISLYSSSGVTGTLFAAGTSSSLKWAINTSSFNPGVVGTLTIFRTSTNGYKAMLNTASF